MNNTVGNGSAHLFWLQWYWITDQVTTYRNVGALLYHIALFIVTIIIHTMEFMYFVGWVLHMFCIIGLCLTATSDLQCLCHYGICQLSHDFLRELVLVRKRLFNSKPTYPMWKWGVHKSKNILGLLIKQWTVGYATACHCIQLNMRFWTTVFTMPSICTVGFQVRSHVSQNNLNTRSTASRFLRPRQNVHHFADDIFRCIFLNEWIPIKISLVAFPKVTMLYGYYCI